MDQFVCVRLVQGNALDLTLFQFDYDMTFAAFLMNADKTIYGRFGSRSERKDAAKDISMEGFGKALTAALELHKGYPGNKALLAGKQSRPVHFKSPEEYPSLKGKYKPTLDYEGKVVQSCMHCHQIRDAELTFFRADKKPIPTEMLYAWAMPDIIGLNLDPKEKATVTNVAAGSAAAKAGFQAGDEILSLEGQPLLSTADVQWVLHFAGDNATLKAEVLRAKKKINLSLTPDKDWRWKTDISWRVSSWDLRRMATGGLVLEDLPEAERRQAKIAAGDLALQVQYVGQYGDHAAGKRAGFQKDDIIVALDGQTKRLTESQAFGQILQSKMPGTKVAMTILRAGERLSLEMPTQ